MSVQGAGRDWVMVGLTTLLVLMAAPLVVFVLGLGADIIWLTFTGHELPSFRRLP